jgi:alkanesulfonate monooxygenase
MTAQFLWYIPNTVQPGHRGDDVQTGWADLELSAELAQLTERHGWNGALIGTGWGRPDTFTIATALASRTTTFRPLAAIRPGYWQPAQFASAAATLDHLSGGRLLVNIVSGQDDVAAYGDDATGSPRRYARTAEFLTIVRRLWHEENVTFRGEHYWVANSTLALRPFGADTGRHPLLYFGGASESAERVAAAHADVQLFWGEPLEGVAQRIDRLKSLTESVGREHAPLEFGLRVTTVVRGTSAEAWRVAGEKVAAMAAAAERAGAGIGGTVQPGTRQPGTGQPGTGQPGTGQPGTAGASTVLASTVPTSTVPTSTVAQADGTPASLGWARATGQQRLVSLAERGEVLDSCLYTTPGKFGGQGAGTTWLVGSYDEVAAALRKYADLGITHFILSDTPYKNEAARVGDELLARLRAQQVA